MWANALIITGTVFIVRNIFRTGVLSLLIHVATGFVVYIALSAVNKPFSIEARRLIRSIVSNGHSFINQISHILAGKETS